MTTREILSVSGYRGEPVAATYIGQRGETDHLGVILPGLDYGAEMPALYYPSRLLLEAGADVLRVQYRYGARDDFASAGGAVRMAWIQADVDAALDAVWDHRPYARVTLVAKSLGTFAAAHLLESRELPAPACVWLTPILGNDRLVEAMCSRSHRALVVVGTADRHHDSAALARVVAATGARTVAIDGAEHSLEIPGDLPGSVVQMARVLVELDAFMREGERAEVERDR